MTDALRIDGITVPNWSCINDPHIPDGRIRMGCFQVDMVVVHVHVLFPYIGDRPRFIAPDTIWQIGEPVDGRRNHNEEEKAA